MDNKHLLELSNVSKSYSEFKALDDVSLSLNSNRIVGLLGPNGSGKTTLMKIIVGLLNDYQGSVLVDGQHIGKATKSCVSYLPDTMSLYEWMSVNDAISFFEDMYADFSSEECRNILEDLGVDHSKKIKNLSKGNQEKLQLALVMSRKAKVYVLDEPIAGVDPATRERVLEVILNHRHEDSLVLLSTHLITDIEDIFDDIIFLKEGHIELVDSREALIKKHKKSINKLFIEVYR